MFYASLVLTLAVGLHAQGPSLGTDTSLTLAGARMLASRSNPRIVAARSALAGAHAAARQAGSLRDPIAVVAREQTASDVWQNTFLLDQPLEVLGQRSSRGAAGRAHAEVAARALDGIIRTVEAEITVAYAAAQTANRQALLTDSIVAAFDRAVTIVERRVTLGDASGYEARRLRLEAARYQGAGAEARSRRLEAHATVAVLLGRDPTAPFDLTELFVVRPVGIGADSLAALAAQSDGRARVASAEALAAAADAARLRREVLPIPSLGLGYKEERAGTGRLVGYLAQLSLPIPIWGSRGAAAAAGAAHAERMDALAADAVRTARREALATAAQATALAERHAALSARLGPEAERARAAADAAFAGGEMTLLEWLDAVRAFHEAAVEATNLAADFVARVAELERLTGLNLLSR